MADQPVPPPPPPPSMRGGKPIPPPPPPGAAKVITPAAPTATAPMPMATPAPMPAAARPAMGMPGMPGMGMNPMEQRLQEMEKRFQDQDGAKKSLESQLNELQRQLKDEHEKLIVQTLKAKEDENLSVRVDQQLREMQEKLRREKYEQELHDSRGRAEVQVREMERRLAEERETWMVALRNQLKEREGVERQVEQDLSHRIQDTERRYQDDRNHWTQTLRMKEEEVAQMRRQFETEIERLGELVEEKDEQVDTLRRTSTEERRALDQQAHQEIRALHAQLDVHARDSAAAKAQAALVLTQLQAAETRFQEEVRRWQDRQAHEQMEFAQDKREWEAELEEERTHWRERLTLVEREMAEMRKQHDHELLARDEEFKREGARRDQERTVYWENVVTQLRAERDGLRTGLVQREEALTRLQVENSEAHRALEVEKARWGHEAEKLKKIIREEVLRDVPEHFKQQMVAERQKWEETQAGVIRQLKAQVAQAREAQQASRIQVEIEQQRMGQEKGFYESKFVQAQADIKILEETREAMQNEAMRIEQERLRERQDWEAQTQDYSRRLAQLQQTADRAVERMQARLHEGGAREAAWTDREMLLNGQMEALQKQLQDQLANQEAWSAKQQEAEHVTGRLREAYNQIKDQMNQMEDEQKKSQAAWAQKETAWTEKETAWQTEKATIEQAAASASAAAAAAAMAATTGPEVAKALTTIRHSMQEMSTLLLWLKPAKAIATQKKAA